MTLLPGVTVPNLFLAALLIPGNWQQGSLTSLCTAALGLGALAAVCGGRLFAGLSQVPRAWIETRSRPLDWRVWVGSAVVLTLTGGATVLLCCGVVSLET